jgi:hypothetical protein
MSRPSSAAGQLPASSPRSLAAAQMPKGWRDVETSQGRHFFIGPAGPTWQPPTTTAVALSLPDAATMPTAAIPSPPQPPSSPRGPSSARRSAAHRAPPVPLASLYMCDYRPMDMSLAQSERREVLLTYSPSQRPHPKGAVADDHRVSLVHHDFAPPPPGSALPPVHPEPWVAEARWDQPPANSTYREEFKTKDDDGNALRVKHFKRPPDTTVVGCPMVYTSINRSDFVEPNARLAKQQRAEHMVSAQRQRAYGGGSRPLDQNGADGEAWKYCLNSTYRAGFDANKTATVNHFAKRRTQFDVERGWSKGPSGGRTWNLKEYDGSTTYRSDFVEEAARGFPHDATMTSRSVDRSIVTRSKMHEDLSEPV